MDLLPTEEQNQIVDASIGFLDKELPVERLHGVDKDNPLMTPALLTSMAELGWFGIGLSEDLGGVGYGLREETLLFVELGRYLVSPAVLGSVLATRVAALAGNDALAQSIMAGGKSVGLCVARYKQRPEIGAMVSGEFYAFESEDADLVLIADEDGVALVEKSAISILGPLCVWMTRYKWPKPV